MTTIANILKREHPIRCCSSIDLFEKEILLSHLLNVSRSYLHAFSERELTICEYDQYCFLIEQRTQGMPIAYLIGHQEFWSLDFQVTTDTLIPRPETELLVEQILARQKNNSAHMSTNSLKSPDPQDLSEPQGLSGSESPSRSEALSGLENLSGSESLSRSETLPESKDLSKSGSLKLADLGTGSGALALACAYEKPSWQVYATDISQSALDIAKKNADRLHIKNVSFYQGSWCDALPHKQFDMIVSNPPYIAENDPYLQESVLRYEPRLALIAAENGLNDLRTIIHQSRHYLKQTGWLFLEHGFQQGERVRNIFLKAGYNSIATCRDLAGLERVTVGQWDSSYF